LKSPIFGPFYVAPSPNIAYQRCINLIPEVVETKTGKEVGALYGTPGLTLFATVGSGPIRGMLVNGGRLYVVSGRTLYGLAPLTNAVTTYGSLTTGAGPVSIIGNGTQTVVFDGVSALGTPNAAGPAAAVALPGTGPASAAYQDGFGVVNQSGSNEWFQSDLLDLLTWQALNFASASANPDNVVAIAQIRREMFLLKEGHTEVWVNVGTTGFVFQRIDGVHIEIGIIAAASVVIIGETLMWLGRNSQGQGIVVECTGFNPKRVSTHAIETMIAAWPDMTDAVAYGVQVRGHVLYVISSSSGDQTFVYDATTSQLAGIPMWHEWASFSGGLFSRHAGNAHALFNGKQIIGDYQNGNLYTLDFTNLTDNGTQRKWLRSWRALAKPSEQPTRFSSLRIDMQTGIGVPDGTNPQCMLRWSDDGGHTWSSERFGAVGPPGATAKRVKFNRLGSTRRNTGLDRIFELSSTDQFPPVIIGAEVE